MKTLCHLFTFFLCYVSTVKADANNLCNNYRDRATNNLIDSFIDYPNDSISILQAFQQLQQHPSFLKDLVLTQGDAQKVQFYVPEGGVVLGDINNDHHLDGLIVFSVQGREGGNSWDVHAALLVYKGNGWHYITQLNCGGNATDYILIFNRIGSGKIYGKSFPSGTDDPQLSKDVVYSLKGSKWLANNNSFQKIATEGAQRWLAISGVQSGKGHYLPFKSTLPEVRAFLGKEDSSCKLRLECGQYFDTDEVRQFFFKGCFIFEVNAKNEAVLTGFKLSDLAFGLKTNMGILDTTTTRKDFEHLFDGQCFRNIEDNSIDRSQSTFLRIPAGPDSDSSWDIYFDTSQKIETVNLFIPC